MLSQQEKSPLDFVSEKLHNVGVIILESSTNAGDNANAAGIIKSTLNLSKRINNSLEFTVLEPIQIIKASTPSGTLETTELEKLQKQLNSPDFDKYIVITTGSHGLKALDNIEKTDRSIFVSSAHQPYIGLLEKTQHKLDLIVLPKSTVDLENPILSKLDKMGKIVKTKGVSHNTTKESLINEYSLIEKRMKEFLQGAKAILCIMGGDAPDQNEVIRPHTPNNAAQLAHYLATNKPLGTKIIVTNGPRTGQKPDLHKIGSDMDEVTKAFKNKLLEQGLKEGGDFLLVDFKFGSPDNIKTDALFGMSLKEGYQIYVPGESTTLVSIAAGLDNVIFYEPDSMNPAHEANLNQFYEGGGVGRLTKEFKYLPSEPKKERNEYEDASSKAAIAILNCVTQNVFKSKSVGL